MGQVYTYRSDGRVRALPGQTMKIIVDRVRGYVQSLANWDEGTTARISIYEVLNFVCSWEI